MNLFHEPAREISVIDDSDVGVVGSSYPGVFAAIRAALLFPIALTLNGCILFKSVGTVIYDLETGKEVAFLPMTSTNHDVQQFIQTNVDTPSFWMTEPYPTKGTHMNLCEYDFDGNLLAKFNPQLGKRKYGNDLAISPDRERLVYFDTNTVQSNYTHSGISSQWHTFSDLKSKKMDGANSEIICPDLHSLTTHKQTLFWLTNDEMMTIASPPHTSPDYNYMNKFIIKINFSTGEIEKLQCQFGRLSNNNAILPSPDGRHVLVQLDKGQKIGIVDIATMELIREVSLLTDEDLESNPILSLDFTWLNNHAFITYFYDVGKVLQYDMETSQLTSLDLPFSLDKYKVVEATERFFILEKRSGMMDSSIWAFDRETKKTKKISPSCVGPVCKLSETRVVLQNAMSAK